jgi:uncharacterized membrane protein YidH (DUF202 family)
MLLSAVPLGIGIASFIIFTKELQMLEPYDTNTADVVAMYIGIFVFLFGLAIILMKKNS